MTLHTAALADGSHKETNCIRTIGEGIAAANAGGQTTVVAGVPINIACGKSAAGFPSASCKIAAAVAAAKAADVAVLCLGTTSQNDEGPAVAHEGSDRGGFALPGSQMELAAAVLALGKPTVLVLVNGGIVAIDELLPKAAAVVEAFLPALQAPVLAQQLFGATNRVSFFGCAPTYAYPPK